jgi:hypothetical protein
MGRLKRAMGRNRRLGRGVQAGFDPVKAFSTEADTGSREKKRVKSKSWTRF